MYPETKIVTGGCSTGCLWLIVGVLALAVMLGAMAGAEHVIPEDIHAGPVTIIAPPKRDWTPMTQDEWYATPHGAKAKQTLDMLDLLIDTLNECAHRERRPEYCR